MDLGNIPNKKLLQGELGASSIIKAQKKQGRPSFKKPDVKYIKVSVDLPEDLVFRIKESLLNKYRGRYKTQTELIFEAVEQYIAH